MYINLSSRTTPPRTHKEISRERLFFFNFYVRASHLTSNQTTPPKPPRGAVKGDPPSWARRPAAGDNTRAFRRNNHMQFFYYFMGPAENTLVVVFLTVFVFYISCMLFSGSFY